MSEELMKQMLETLKKMQEQMAEKASSESDVEDEWTITSEPFQEDMDLSRREDYEELITIPTDMTQKKKLEVYRTETLLDRLFLDNSDKCINGIPLGIQLSITGTPGAGKSILMEEVAIRAAHRGTKVLYVTSEDIFISSTGRYDLQSRMMDKSMFLGLEWSKIRENLYVMDTVAKPELREWNTFAEVLRYTSERNDIKLIIIDSVTILESYRGALKYRVMELARFNQTRGITGLYVNQRIAESFDKYDVAGGIALIHNLDATVLVDKGRTYYGDQTEDLGVKRGAVTYMVRVADCRLCGFVREHIQTYITKHGLLRVTPKGEEVLRKYA